MPSWAGWSPTSKRIERAELRERYEAEFMAAMKKLATPARHVNVMQHIAGYLRDRCDADSRRELMEADRGLSARNSCRWWCR